MAGTEGHLAHEVPGLYGILPLRTFRRTPGVHFDVLDPGHLPRIDAIDRVIHSRGAVSPGPAAGVQRPWYMHPFQADNLMVLHGTRDVDLYSRAHGRVENFKVTADSISKGGEVLFTGPAMLVWPAQVFHRILSSPDVGSASVNFAVHFEGWDVRSNFNIYGLDTGTGEFRVLREGHLDQPGP